MFRGQSEKQAFLPAGIAAGIAGRAWGPTKASGGKCMQTEGLERSKMTSASRRLHILAENVSKNNKAFKTLLRKANPKT